MKKFILAIMPLMLFPLTAFGDIITWPLFQAFDENGDPLNGGLVYTYNCGGLVAKTTYSDAAMTAANANPVVLNARGEADIYAAGCTHLVIKTALGVAVEETDNYGETYIDTIADADVDTQIQVEESAGENIIRFDAAATEQIIISDGSITPTLDSDIDLGTNALQFANIYVNTIYGSVLGFVQRPLFTRTDGNTLTIGPGIYHHSGTSVQTVYWNSDITFELGNDGSNVASDGTQADLGAAGFHYIYLDDNAIVTQASSLLDADCFLNDTTAPAWSDAKHGWYGTGAGGTSTSDRCIFAVNADAMEMLVFWHNGGDYVSYDDTLVGYADADPGTDWSTEVTLTIPAFATKAKCHFATIYVSSDSQSYWRQGSSTGTTGNEVGVVVVASTRAVVIDDVFTNSSLKIDIKVSGADPTLGVDIKGWYFPNGM